jgi:hypothetical protein
MSHIIVSVSWKAGPIHREGQNFGKRFFWASFNFFWAWTIFMDFTLIFLEMVTLLLDLRTPLLDLRALLLDLLPQTTPILDRFSKLHLGHNSSDRGG